MRPLMILRFFIIMLIWAMRLKCLLFLGGNIDNFLSLGYFHGYNASLNPYCICLGDLPKIIMLTTFFNPSYDFSMTIDKVKRIPILVGVVFIIASYLLFSELWSQEFDKLLHALMMPDLKG